MLTGRARRVGLWLTMGVGLFGVLHIVLHRYHEWFDGLPAGLGRWPDMNSEASIATWYNISLLVLVAASAALAAAAEPKGRRRWGWGTLAGMVLLLSIDEKAQVHERLPDVLGMTRGTSVTHEWLLPGLALVGVGLAVLVYLLRALDRPVRVGLLLALVVYAAGAVVVEGLTGMAVRSLPAEHLIRVALPVWELLEESLEMLGCILALVVVLSHLERAGALVLGARSGEPGLRDRHRTGDRTRAMTNTH